MQKYIFDFKAVLLNFSNNLEFDHIIPFLQCYDTKVDLDLG